MMNGMKFLKSGCVLCLFFALQAVHAQQCVYYVSPDGSDAQPGTKAAPWKSLAHAVRQVSGRSNGSAAVRIVLRDGVYPMEEPVRMKGVRKLSIEAEHTGKVVLEGAVPVTEWEVTTDSSILAFLPKNSVGKVWQTDLRKAGVEPYVLTGNRNRIDVYCNGRRMHPARWPNATHTLSGKAVGAGDPRDVVNYRNYKGCAEGLFEYRDGRIRQWAKDTQDVYLHGYWFWDWAEDYQKLEAVDTVAKHIRLCPPYHRFGYRDECRFYGMNLLCELDTLDEYCIRRQQGKLYVYLPEGVRPSDCIFTLSRFSGDFMLDADSVSDFSLSGLVLEGGRNGAVRIRHSENFRMKECRISRFGDDAVIWQGNKDCRMISCLLEQLGHGGLVAEGGNRKTLESADYCVENTVFSDFSLYKATYEPAILFKGAGMCIRHNEFRGSTSSALRMDGNDILIEYNRFSRLVVESDDQGALDVYFNFTYRGVVIRYNYWKDIVGSMHEGASGVRLDDIISGYKVSGNVFDCCGGGKFGAVQINGGKDNIVENNLMYHCNKTVSASEWKPGRWENILQSERVQTHFREVDFPSALYRSRYPELDTDEPLESHHYRNFIRNNLSVCPTKRMGTFRLPEAFVMEDNTEVEEKEDAPIEYFLRKRILRRYGLQPIPFRKMGVQKNPYVQE